MKNIKLIVMLAVCLAPSVLLKAQQENQLKTQVVKEGEVKPPPPVDVNKMPAPGSGKINTDEGMKSGKPVLLQKPVNTTGSLTPEQVKTANGTVQKPVMTTAPGTEQKPEKAKPVVITTTLE